MHALRELDAQQLHNLMLESNGNNEIVLLDVRSPAEAARGGIRGARNVPLHLLPIAGQDLGQEASVVLYCHSGARSAQGCAFLATRGYSNVFNLRGGILGWTQSGQPLVPIDGIAAGA